MYFDTKITTIDARLDLLRLMKALYLFFLFNILFDQPVDWDDEDDGLWKAPKIPNPAYKGPWKRKVLHAEHFKS